MFKRSDKDKRPTVQIFVDGVAVATREGDTVSAALFASGRDMRRATAVSGAARLPYCMMGVCFDCLVTIDGVGNRQGCLVPVAEGMQVVMADRDEVTLRSHVERRRERLTDVRDGLVRIRSERGNVDQANNLRIIARFGDDQTTIGVPHKDHRPFFGGDDTFCRCHVVCEGG